MRIGLVCPNPADATSFYRAHGVFSHIPGIEIVTHDWWSWEQLLTIDILFCQRVCEPAPLALIQLAKKLGKPVWIDYDDDLFRVPALKNPCWETYAKPSVQENMREIIRAADLVTTTNAFLSWGLQESVKATKEQESKFVTVPNAFNDYLWQSQDSSLNKIVAWRGSVTHYADMEPYIPEMIACSHAHRDWSWLFMGSPHWGIEGIPGAAVLPHTNLFDYMTHFRKTSPGIVIVPLIDHEFNRAKSNIAALEAIMAGALVVCPDWIEWTIPGTFRYATVKGFGNALDEAMTMGDAERQERQTWSRDWVVKNRLLSVVNKQRESLLLSLAKPIL